jgi:hypothetical protein
MNTNLNRLRKAFLLRPLFPELWRTSRETETNRRWTRFVFNSRQFAVRFASLFSFFGVFCAFRLRQAYGATSFCGYLFSPETGSVHLRFVFLTFAALRLCVIFFLSNLWILNLDLALR